MPLTQTHDLHRRRLGRNIGVALSLLGFCVIVFGLTIAKVRQGASLEAYDHIARPSITVEDTP
ncbi:MAG: hypothetical protein AAGF88_06235 [Pseudomonadota bacterium]